MKKLILCISMLVFLFIGCFYFWDLRNEVSEIKAVVTGQAENADTVKKDNEKIQNNKNNKGGKKPFQKNNNQKNQ